MQPKSLSMIFLRSWERANLQITCRYLASDVEKKIYDLLVVGAGSGGLACSKQASELGAKVILIDAVKPSLHGTTWGIGGTCVNVGCIPKKLMHLAALNGEMIRHCESYGWKGANNISLDWSTLINAVQAKIKAINWIYRVQLKEKKIDYVNGFASFLDQNTVKVTTAGKRKVEYKIKANHIVLATGLRPKYPAICGAELGITSDDLFSLKSDPGKTLVVGSSYVGLECAGLLQSLCGSAHLMVRSIPLRGFDQQCAEMVLADMALRGLKVLRYVQPTKVEKVKNGSLEVTYCSLDEKKLSSETFDTVIWAIGKMLSLLSKQELNNEFKTDEVYEVTNSQVCSGREPQPGLLNLKNIGIEVAKSGKIIVDKMDQTSVKSIYAIGDTAEGRPELSPPSIRAGRLLAQRLFSNSVETMDYKSIPTTVFTPLEYSSTGFSEEVAIERYGEKNIEVYHTYYEPYEFIIPRNESSVNCYIKLITERRISGRVLGIHFIGPNAAEVMQGFTAALTVQVTKEQLFNTIPIHPCSAEEIIRLTVTKRSGIIPAVPSCCG